MNELINVVALCVLSGISPDLILFTISSIQILILKIRPLMILEKADLVIVPFQLSSLPMKGMNRHVMHDANIASVSLAHFLNLLRTDRSPVFTPLKSGSVTLSDFP